MTSFRSLFISLRSEELFQDIWSCGMYDDGATVVSLHADLMPYYIQMMSCPFCVNVNPLTVYLPGAWDLCSLTVMHFPSFPGSGSSKLVPDQNKKSPVINITVLQPRPPRSRHSPEFYAHCYRFVIAFWSFVLH